jgi:hypothetical protein
MRYVWTGTKRGLSVESCGVLVEFSPAGCTSIQIVMTLRYE